MKNSFIQKGGRKAQSLTNKQPTRRATYNSHLLLGGHSLLLQIQPTRRKVMKSIHLSKVLPTFFIPQGTTHFAASTDVSDGVYNTSVQEGKLGIREIRVIAATIGAYNTR